MKENLLRFEKFLNTCNEEFVMVWEKLAAQNFLCSTHCMVSRRCIFLLPFLDIFDQLYFVTLLGYFVLETNPNLSIHCCLKKIVLSSWILNVPNFWVKRSHEDVFSYVTCLSLYVVLYRSAGSFTVLLKFFLLLLSEYLSLLTWNFDLRKQILNSKISDVFLSCALWKKQWEQIKKFLKATAGL